MRKSCKKSKFTLIEMLAVIAIIGVLLTVVLPGFLRAMKGNELVRAGQTLSAALQKARAEAIISRKTASVIFYEDRTRQYIGVRYYSQSEHTELIKWYELDKDIKIARVFSQGTDPFFNYDANGIKTTERSWLEPYRFSGTTNSSFAALATETITWKRQSSGATMRVLSFNSSGKVIAASSNNNLYFGIVNKIEIPASGSTTPIESAKLELNYFTGEVRWLQN
ncbi:MAG: prepilin-type N-terminal cleavage/methylation domain-containing protein [Lentisphaeria bacterium]|nr:prepilin-type N-terminal cleavage/methylation domain-containing protein [Lentisphaeria bacterium]